jgi:putative membrane protein
MDYDDMRGYVDFLDTYSRDANVGVDSTPPKAGKLQRIGEVLGLTVAQSNPRVMIKNAQKPLGNLPLEILTYLQGYIDSLIVNGTLKTPIFQVQSITSLATLNDILCGTDRILNTPLPVAYSITIAQISWVYILLLPFQLVTRLSWNTVPATMLAAYIILGFGLIGREIENPFGREVNDLPLESFCEQIAYDIDIIMSKPAPKPQDFVRQVDNMPLYPLSMAGYSEWMERPVEDLRAALKTKVITRAGMRQGRGYDGADSRVA